MQITSKKTKPKKSSKVNKAKNKQSKLGESTTKKASGEITDTVKSPDQENTAPDPTAVTDSIDPKGSNKNQKSETVKKSNAKKSKQKQPSVEEMLTEIINTNKITGDANAEQDSEDTADPDEAAAEQSKVEESQIRHVDVPVDQENIAPDPNAVTGGIDPKGSNKNQKSETVKKSNGKKSKQKQPPVEETITGTTDAGETAEDAQDEQVWEETVDSGDVADEEQNEVEEPLTQETDISSEQNDAAADPIVADGVAEATDAAPEKGEEIATSQIFEAIQKITKSQGDLPGQPITEEKSTTSFTSGQLEICAGEIMQNEVTWASPDDSLQQAIAKMQQTNAGYIMVGQNGALEGIVSKSDITKAMSPYLLPIFAKWRRPLDDATLKIRIKWIMSRPVRTIKPETSLAAIMEHMNQFRGRCLPVMDEEGNVQGLVTAYDIFQALLKSNSNTCSTGEAPRESVKTASSTETT